jgi:hypothetical protein
MPDNQWLDTKKMNNNMEKNALFESIHEQLFLAWAVSPSSWFNKPGDEWQSRVHFFIQRSIEHLLPLYTRTHGYQAQLPNDTAAWLIQNPRDGLSAFTRCILVEFGLLSESALEEEDENERSFSTRPLSGRSTKAKRPRVYPQRIGDE